MRESVLCIYNNAIMRYTCIVGREKPRRQGTLKTAYVKQENAQHIDVTDRIDMKGDIIMKFKTTRKAIVNGSSKIVSVGYCDLQSLLINHSPIAYTCGVYGWNYDVYEIDGLTICTGYRGMPGKSAEHCREYDKKAQNILSWENKAMSYDEKRENVEKLLREWISLQ